MKVMAFILVLVRGSSLEISSPVFTKEGCEVAGRVFIEEAKGWTGHTPWWYKCLPTQVQLVMEK